jgi:predicted permease
MGWIRQLLARRRIYADLSAEVQAHLGERIDELVAAGMPREEAAAIARREFGNATLIEESGREVWQWLWVENALRDVRFGLRMLRKSPVFTIVAVLTLALGIGASVALYTIVDGAFLHPFLTPNSDRKILLRAQFPNQKTNSWLFSVPEYLEIRARNHVFSDLTPQREGSQLNLSDPPRIVSVLGARVSAGSLAIDGVAPLLGRLYSAAEDRPGGPPVTVLSWELWRNRFQSDPNIIGKSVRLSGASYTVVGVMPRRYRVMGAELWLPLQLNISDTDRSHRTLFVVGHLKAGVTLDQASRELRSLATAFEKEAGGATPEYAGWSVDAFLIRDVIVGELKPALFLLLGALGLVLLISAANLANLMLARATARRKEVAIRLLHGAGRARVLRQLIIEGLLVSLMGGTLGVVIAYSSIQSMLSVIPADYIATEAEIRINPTILAGGFLLAVLMGLLIALPAAFEALRGDLGKSLKEAGRSLVSLRSGGGVRRGLVIAEIALAVIVLAGAGLMTRSYLQITKLPLGFRPEHVLVMHLALAPGNYPRAAKVAGFYEELERRLETAPGLESAAMVSQAPMEGWDVDTHDFLVEGRALERGGLPNADERIVSPEYFRTMGIDLLEGRGLEAGDRDGSLPVAVINETMARLYWPGKSAVGQRIRLGHGNSRARMLVDTGTGSGWLSIVGVVRDARQRPDLLRDIRPEIDLPLSQSADRIRDMALVVRAPGAGALDIVRREVAMLDAQLPVYRVENMEQIVADGHGPRRLALMLLGWFAAMALLLVVIGVYATMAYAVSQRAQEMGLRMALGAVPADIARLMLGQGMRLALFGVVLGVAGALGMTRLMGELLYGVIPTDPLTFAAVALLLWMVALAACYAPARRAVRVDPMVALRHE